MSEFRRTGAVGLSSLGLVALFVFVVVAAPPEQRQDAKPSNQVKTPAKDKDKSSPAGAKEDLPDDLLLPTNRETTKRLELARTDYLAAQSWGEALRLLQAVLEDQGDVFVPVRGKDPKHREPQRWVSARFEANRVLGTLPPKGLELYEREYGTRARKLLADAVKGNTPAGLALVARRYAHTAAGAEATDRLSRWRKEWDKAPPAVAGPAPDWPLFRGDARRSGQGKGKAPAPEIKWQRSNLDLRLPAGEWPRLNPATRKWVEEALRQQQLTPEPMIPTFSPISARGLLIYRSFWGIHCVDIKTGELLWDSQTEASLDALVRDLNKKGDVQNWFTLYKQGANHNILFENSVVGTLSADRERVYAVDDLALPPHPTAMQGNPWGWNGGPNMGAPITELTNRSRLVAIDLETGKLVWEHGDPQRDTTELAGCYFLGPPLPLAGKLYVLTEKSSELSLVCLDAVDGKPAWVNSLGKVGKQLPLNPNRRIQAVQLAYADGILVCPTNAGVILGIDLVSRSPVWAFSYREKTKEAAAPRPDPKGRQTVGPPRDGSGLQKLSGEWKMTAPVIQDGKVVFTAPDGSGIHCLNLQDGEPLWQAERRDDLYLAGVFGGKVLLVGKNSCRALSLADGKKELWKVDTGVPSGMGVASGSVYYLPLKKGEVYKIDLTKGVVAAHTPLPKAEVPGNLLFGDGLVISQTETEVTCYPAGGP